MVALDLTETGLRIRSAREEMGWSQPELALAIGLKHPQSISNYERGLTDVPAQRLRRIAEITGKPLSYFIDEPPPPMSATPPETSDLAAAIRQFAENQKALADAVDGLTSIVQDQLVPQRHAPARRRRAS